MRHRNKNATLNRPSDQRLALLRSLATALFQHQQICTTAAKAKALKPMAERLITRIKGKNDREAIRDAMQVLYTTSASKSLLDYAKKTTKSSGFISCKQSRWREGDQALMVTVTLLT